VTSLDPAILDGILASANAERRERARRLDAARAAIAPLKPDEVQEIFLELAAQMSNRGHATPTTTTSEPTGARPTISTTSQRIPPTMPSIDPSDMTLRKAIATVLFRQSPLGTGEIIKAVREFMPDAKYDSLASEVKKMRVDELLQDRDRNEKGHARYALTEKGKREVTR
jgi:hypothetical protein